MKHTKINLLQASRFVLESGLQSTNEKLNSFFRQFNTFLFHIKTAKNYDNTKLEFACFIADQYEVDENGEEVPVDEITALSPIKELYNPKNGYIKITLEDGTMIHLWSDDYKNKCAGEKPRSM